MRPLLLLPATALLLTGCAATPRPSAVLDVGAPSVPPDLAGHQDDRPDADLVLVAGDTATLTTPTGTFHVTVRGPAVKVLPTLVPLRVGQLHSYLATFTVTATPVRGTQRLSPADFRLLAIADRVDGGSTRTTVAKATTLVTRTLTRGSWTGTWSAPFVEGHGELLFTPAGAARPAALWDFRVES